MRCVVEAGIVAASGTSLMPSLGLVALLVASADPASLKTPDARADARVAFAMLAEAPRDSAAEPPPSDKPLAEPDTEILVRARPRPPKIDPLMEINLKAFEFTESIDKAIVGPASMQYEKTVPTPIRNGLRNVIANLYEPITFLNYMLQLNAIRSVQTLVRFVVNSTVGIVGLFDMARRKPLNLPYRRNGLANTFGYYGLKPGAYIFLPIVGPATVRDLIGDNLDRIILPTVLGSPFNKPLFAIGVGVERAVDRRVAFDEQLAELRKTNDPYAARRALYFQTREAEIEALRQDKGSIYRRSVPKAVVLEKVPG